MKIYDLTARAGRSLRNAKARTILTSLAIAVGAFTLTATLAAGNGIRAYTDRLIANNFDPAELIVGRDKEIENTGTPDTAPKEYDESVASLSFGGGEGGSMQLKQITDEDLKELEERPEVTQVRPNYQLNLRYITREGQKRYTLSAQTYNPGQRPVVEAGALTESGDIEAGTLLLPVTYLEPLGFKNAEEAIGKEVTVAAQQPFTQDVMRDYYAQMQAGLLDPDDVIKPKMKEWRLKVSAVTKRGAASIAVGGMTVILNGTDTRDIYDFTMKGTPEYGKYMYAYVRVDGAEDAAVAAKAKADLKADGYYVQTSQDIQKTITQVVDLLQILVGVFGVITVIASVFGIINTMYISVLERTREIGLMKALGARGVDVGWLFRIEAAWIGFLGGALGALTAYLIGTALNPWLTKTLGLGDGNTILIFDAVQILILILILILVAILAGWLPARKAAKLDPIEALRTE